MINKPFTFTNKPFSPQNSVVVNIIWANVIVYFVFLILSFFPFGRTLFDLFSFNPHQPLYISFYSLVTNIFLHAGFMHLLGNMLWLYFVGTILEDLIGSKHIIRLFFFGGILGAFLFYIFAQITGISGLLVGASGGIAALLIATALFAPNYRVFLL